MSFLSKLFGRFKNPVPPKNEPAAREKKFRAFDKYGREVWIGAEDWRKSVLPTSIKAAWNDADQLAGLIRISADDGLIADVLDAARRLYEIDGDHMRGLNTYAFILIRNGRVNDAEKILREHIRKHGEDPLVLTNLAKVHFERKQLDQVEGMLWRTLQLDPNQENALPWYAATLRERSGRDAEIDAFKRAAALPNSWRPQMWLGRFALEDRDVERAVAHYNDAITRAPKPPPFDVLMQISGDLGNKGYLPEILKIVQPHFDAKTHGIRVGNNLIKTLFDLGQLDAAERLVNELHAVKTADWQPVLSYWETEIAKARVAIANPPPQNLSVSILEIDGPVWLKRGSPATELFPALPSDGPRIAFVGFTVEVATNSKRVERQQSDTPGRFSRGIPLLLAEQTEFNTTSPAVTLIPWANDGAFVLAGEPWPDDQAAGFALGSSGTKSDFVVTAHFKTQSEPWPLELRLVRAIDSKCVATLSSTVDPQNPQKTIPHLTSDLFKMLAEHADTQRTEPPQIFNPPADHLLAHYLLRIEQLLAVRCSAMEKVPREFLSGAREIVDGNIQLCLDCPQNIGIRILLANTLLALKKVRPEILPEYKPKLDLLRKDHPLSEIADAVIQRIIDDALTAPAK